MAACRKSFTHLTSNALASCSVRDRHNGRIPLSSSRCLPQPLLLQPPVDAGTLIGGEFFAYYKTTFSKSRENFLKILLQGKRGYEINEAMIWYLFQCGVKDDILNLLEDDQGKTYSSTKGLNRLLNSVEIEGKKLRKQCHEAGLVG